MIVKRIRGLTIVPALLYALSVQAQATFPYTLNASGGSGEIAGNTYEYSIGEMTLVHTASTPNLVVTQGLLQPMEAVSAIAEWTLPANALTVYPNPSDDIVYIQPEIEGGGKLTLTLMDITGRHLQQRELALQTGSEKQSMDLHALAAGTYMLHVTFTRDQKHIIRNFKIQKTK